MNIVILLHLLAEEIIILIKLYIIQLLQETMRTSSVIMMERWIKNTIYMYECIRGLKMDIDIYRYNFIVGKVLQYIKRAQV